MAHLRGSLFVNQMNNTDSRYGFPLVMSKNNNVDKNSHAILYPHS